MNNVSPINKAQRLTEAEVHAAAEELQEAGGKVSSIELYRHLGRGSLTTITNFLKSWRPGEEEKSTLPALIGLPDSLKTAGEQLIIKLWAESQKLAESKLQSQREGLRLAEAMAGEKIEEAQAFSDEQAKQIEELKVQIEILKKEAGESHELFLFEEKNLRNDLNQSRKNENIFEQRFIETEKQLNKEVKEKKELNKQRDEAIEKAARLEGELNTWKILQPKETEIKEKSKKAIKPTSKQTDVNEIIN